VFSIKLGGLLLRGIKVGPKVKLGAPVVVVRLVSAVANGNGMLALTWSNGVVALLPNVDLNAKLAECAASAPVV
jgi:hypothetical protein